MAVPAIPHILIVGTGITALSTALNILKSSDLPSQLRLTLVDKAAKPGGRLSTRTYGDVSLDTGARIIRTTRSSRLWRALQKEKWTASTGLKHISNAQISLPEKVAPERVDIEDDLKPNSKKKKNDRYRQTDFALANDLPNGFGGEGGWVEKIVERIRTLAREREGVQLVIIMDHKVEDITSYLPAESWKTPNIAKSRGTGLIDSNTSPLPDIPEADTIVLTLPLPQLPAILPPFLHRHIPTEIRYESIFSLILPAIVNPASPPKFNMSTQSLMPFSKIYRAQPSSKITAISTGYEDETGASKGLVIQALASDLGHPDWSSTKDKNELAAEDKKIAKEFIKLLRADPAVVDSQKIDQIERMVMPISNEIEISPIGKKVIPYQIKRWRYAQPRSAESADPTHAHQAKFIHLDKPNFARVIIAGDWMKPGINDRTKGVSRAWAAGDTIAVRILASMRAERPSEGAGKDTQ